MIWAFIRLHTEEWREWKSCGLAFEASVTSLLVPSTQETSLSARWGPGDLIFPRPFSEGILRMPRHGWCPPAEKYGICQRRSRPASTPRPPESGLPPLNRLHRRPVLRLTSPPGCQATGALGTEGKHYHLRGVSGIDPGGAQLLPPPGCGRGEGEQDLEPGSPVIIGFKLFRQTPEGHHSAPHPSGPRSCRQEAFRAEMSVNKENKSRASICGSKKMFPQFKTSPAWENKVKWRFNCLIWKLRLFYSHKNVLDLKKKNYHC